MCISRTGPIWTADEVVSGVSAFLQSQRRAHLRKELQGALKLSPSTVDKLVLGQLPSISAHVLLSLNEHFGGELIRSLRGSEDDASRALFKHLDAIRRIANEHL